jgi:subtilisin family serine protease
VLASELLVRLAPGAPPLPTRPLGASVPVAAEAPFAPLGLQRVRVPLDAAPAYAARLGALPGVRGVEPNARVQAATAPNDPYFGDYQWNLRQIRAPEAWDLTTGDRRVIIAIVDTGIALDHPDLAAKLVPGINLVTPDQPPNDDNGHGTHVAGIAAAATNNAEGVAGVSWEARLMPVKALDADGGADVDRVAQGMVWAVDHGARVLNLSFTGAESTAALGEAVQYARDHGALVVAAVGNDGRAEATYPAALEGVLAVGATDRNDQRLSSSNTGPYVALAAPGQQVPSTFWAPGVGNTYAQASTTSQAPPHVAGVAGLIWSVNPELRGDAVRALLVNHADDVWPPGRDDETGAGRVDALRSVLAALPWNYDSGGAAAYRGPSEAAPRIYLPYVVKAADGWTSSIVVRNPLAQATTATISFLGPGGATVASTSASLSGFGATTLPLQTVAEVPGGFRGAAVIEAGGGITALVEQDRAGGSRHGYLGVSSGAPRLYAPLVEKGGRRGSSVLYVQNLAEARETATVSYYSPAGALLGQDSATLPPRAVAAVRLAEATSLPDGFVGAALIDSAGGGGLGAVAAQLGGDGAATSYLVPNEAVPTLAAPLVFKRAGGWSTGIQVLNVGATPAQVTVSYSRPAGVPAPVQEVIAIPARGSATIYQPANPALPDEYVGSATLTATGGGPLVAVVNQARADSSLVMTYPAAPSGGAVVDVPLLTKDYGGWTAGLRVQNIAADTAEVSVIYYDQTGRPLYTAQNTLAPGDGTTYTPASITALPWGFQGTATVTSNGRPLAAVVNLLKPAP